MNKFIIILLCSFFSCSALETRITAFNSGQANCIGIEHNRRLAFVDAGYGAVNKLLLLGRIKNCYNSLLARDTTAFITHWHMDHYNLLGDLGVKYENIFCISREADKKRFTDELTAFCMSRYDSEILVNKNTNSSNSIYLMLVNGVKVVFSGDAEQRRRYILKDLPPDLIRTLENYPPIDQKKKLQSLYKNLSNEQINIKIAQIKDTRRPRKVNTHYTQYSYNMSEFIHSNIVFLPHHGSETHGSNQFNQLISGAQYAVICSDGQYLPKKDVLYNLKQQNPGKVYLTGESKGGYYAFSIWKDKVCLSDGGANISCYDIQILTIQGGKQQQTKDIKKTQGKPEKQLLKAEKSLAKATNKQLKAKEAVAAAAEQKKQAKQDIATAKKEIKLANGQAKKKAPSASSTKK